MDEYNYDTLASTVKIEDITSDEINQVILRQLMDNELQKNLWICNSDDYMESEDIVEYDCPGDDIEQLGWLGYYIGRRTRVCRSYISFQYRLLMLLTSTWS